MAGSSEAHFGFRVQGSRFKVAGLRLREPTSHRALINRNRVWAAYTIVMESLYYPGIILLVTWALNHCKP